MNTSKIAKSTKRIDSFLKVIRGISLAAVIVCICVGICVAFFGEKMVADASSISIGAARIKISEAYCPTFGELKGIIYLGLMIGIVGGMTMWYCLGVARTVLAPMKEGRPFEAGTADKIRKLGFVVIGSGVILQFCRYFAAITEVKAYDLQSFFRPEVVQGVEFSYEFDINFLYIAAVLFLMAHIFRYGEGLQQESDETL